MIDYLNFIDELSTVENLLKEGKDSEFNIIIASGKIRDLKRKYENRISEFESDMAPKDKFSTEINQIADSVSLIAWLFVKILV